MHLIIATRGHKFHEERFIRELQSQWCPLPKKNIKTGVIDNTNLAQIAVRPYQLYEVIFPKEWKDVVCKTLLDNSDKGKTHHKRHRPIFSFIRKVLGIKPIPDWDEKAPIFPIVKDNVEIVGIGLKEDGVMKTPDGDWEYEAL